LVRFLFTAVVTAAVHKPRLVKKVAVAARRLARWVGDFLAVMVDLLRLLVVVGAVAEQ
jgi:hypothetical protein